MRKLLFPYSSYSVKLIHTAIKCNQDSLNNYLNYIERKNSLRKIEKRDVALNISKVEK